MKRILTALTVATSLIASGASAYDSKALLEKLMVVRLISSFFDKSQRLDGL
jgi:hypothetical protein